MKRLITYVLAILILVAVLFAAKIALGVMLGTVLTTLKLSVLGVMALGILAFVGMRKLGG